MKTLVTILFLLSSALVLRPAPTHAAGTSFTFTNGPVACGPHPSCYVTRTSLGGWYYLYSSPPTAMTGGTVPNVYMNFNTMATAGGPVSSLSGLVAATWTQIAGGAALNPANQYEMRGTFTGTDNYSRAYAGTLDLFYGIYYSRGGGGRGGGGAGWHFTMLKGTATISYR